MFFCAYIAIIRRFSKVALTILSIAVGVFSVILINNIGSVSQIYINSELDNLGFSAITIVPESGKIRAVDPSIMEAIENNDEIKNIAPIIYDYAYCDIKNEEFKVVGIGINSNASDVVGMELLHGRLVNKSDVENNRLVCVIDESLAQQSYKRSNIVGKTITIKSDGSFYDFTVIGVVNASSILFESLVSGVMPSFAYMPYTTFQQITNRQGLSQLALTISDGYDAQETGENIISTINSRISNGETYKFENLSAQKDQIDSVLDIITLCLAAIAGISLFVAGLGIMNIMIISVSERTKEIGIKKSIGATNSQIVKEFLAESALMSFIGCILGGITAIVVTTIACLILGIPITINWTSSLYCLIISVLIGVFFGVWPSFKAAKLDPIDALRHY